MCWARDLFSFWLERQYVLWGAHPLDIRLWTRSRSGSHNQDYVGDAGVFSCSWRLGWPVKWKVWWGCTQHTRLCEARLGVQFCCGTVACLVPADSWFVLCALLSHCPSPKACCRWLPIVISSLQTFMGIPKTRSVTGSTGKEIKMQAGNTLLVTT